MQVEFNENENESCGGCVATFFFSNLGVFLRRVSRLKIFLGFCDTVYL